MNSFLSRFPVRLQIVSGIAFVFIIISCNQHPETSKKYVEEIDRWHQQRIESLKQEDSWLSLAGLYWLKEGKNSFGGNPGNDIVFPADKVPDSMGWFILSEGKVSVRINPEVNVLIEGTAVTDTVLTTDAEGKPTILSYESLHWYVIERGDRTGIRMKDSGNPALASFEGIDRFPVSASWRIEACYVKFEEPKTIHVPDILGQVNEWPLYGTLEFDINGETYKLDPLGGPESDELFVIFGDETNGEETYGGGRFVYVSMPDENGITHIDFNKAYNPPCVFNKFATCPLPPTQNKLSVEVRAGEKNYEDGSKH